MNPSPASQPCCSSSSNIDFFFLPYYQASLLSPFCSFLLSQNSSNFESLPNLTSTMTLHPPEASLPFLNSQTTYFLGHLYSCLSLPVIFLPTCTPSSQWDDELFQWTPILWYLISPKLLLSTSLLPGCLYFCARSGLKSLYFSSCLISPHPLSGSQKSARWAPTPLGGL